MKVFQNEPTPDRIINGNARKPMLPNEYVIEELGMGKSFIEFWKTKYKIKNHELA